MNGDWWLLINMACDISFYEYYAYFFLILFNYFCICCFSVFQKMSKRELQIADYAVCCVCSKYHDICRPIYYADAGNYLAGGCQMNFSRRPAVGLWRLFVLAPFGRVGGATALFTRSSPYTYRRISRTTVPVTKSPHLGFKSHDAWSV